MTYVRVTRDARGYETTLLLHASRPGDRPRVLYWYRSAPGVRVGRRALDEDAIRTIEEQHPTIDFDWPTLLEESEAIEPEAERRPERPRRKPRPQDATELVPALAPDASTAGRPAAANAPTPSNPPSAPGAPSAPSAPGASGSARAPQNRELRRDLADGGPRNPLLDQLVGREIAARLRGRYADVAVRLAELPDDSARQAWQQRADALNPDRWTTPEQILHGIQHADRLFDELKRELP